MFVIVNCLRCVRIKSHYSYVRCYCSLGAVLTACGEGTGRQRKENKLSLRYTISFVIYQLGIEPLVTGAKCKYLQDMCVTMVMMYFHIFITFITVFVMFLPGLG